jgi:hypothetical protein
MLHEFGCLVERKSSRKNDAGSAPVGLTVALYEAARPDSALASTDHTVEVEKPATATGDPSQKRGQRMHSCASGCETLRTAARVQLMMANLRRSGRVRRARTTTGQGSLNPRVLWMRGVQLFEVRQKLGRWHFLGSLDRDLQDISLAELLENWFLCTRVLTLGQTHHRLPSNFIVPIRQPRCQRTANLRRILLAESAQSESRPVPRVLVVVGSKLNQRLKGDVIGSAAEGIRKGTPHVLG